ncbi:polysaccharide deacetylase family protein [Candidatus Omnitrophota bacterium]
MKIFKKIFIYSFIFVFVAFCGFRLYLLNKTVVPIVMYHNVENIDLHKSNWTSVTAFKQQMDFLRRYNYNVISLETLVTAIENGESLPKKSIVITFDDGYENNYLNAFPLLENYGFPATIFIPTDFIGKPGYLNGTQMLEMTASVVTIGSHTKIHDYLPDMTPDEQLAQIVGSKWVLEERLGMPIDFIAYPIGGFTEEIKGMVKKAGYKAACATNRGYDRFNKDVYELNRVRFSSSDNSCLILWAKLSGYYNLFRKAKSPY